MNHFSFEMKENLDKSTNSYTVGFDQKYPTQLHPELSGRVVVDKIDYLNEYLVRSKIPLVAY